MSIEDLYSEFGFRRVDARGREGFSELRLSQLETTLAALRAASGRCERIDFKDHLQTGVHEPGATAHGEDKLSRGPRRTRAMRR